MAYYFNKTLALPFDTAIERVTQALGAEGFGIITDIDVTKTLRAKLNEDFRPYRILGACNPALVFEALKLEDKVGTMLPCNVVVQEIGAGQVEVAAIDPVASMQAIPNARLLEKAELVGQKLRRVIDAL
jgi:uncharacterized protein (DUF302 family)